MKKIFIAIGLILLVVALGCAPKVVYNEAGEKVTHANPEGASCRDGMGDCQCLPEGCLTCTNGICSKT